MTEKEFYHWMGQRIRELREKTGLKQKDVAEQAGISAQFLSDIENRGKKVSAFQLNNVLKAIGVTYDDIFGESEKKNSLLRLTAIA